MIRTLVLVSILGLISCGGGSSGDSTTPDNPCGGGGADVTDNPCGNGTGDAPAGGPEVDFSGWDGWTKMSTSRHLSKGHGKSWVEVFVAPEIADTYRAATGPYPEGAKIVKAQYATEDSTEVQKITVMAKMTDDYDSENGNWYYGVFDASGSKAMMEGKLEGCIDCHDSASEKDYAFGLPK